VTTLIEALPLVGTALAAALVLGGMHSYLGFHIVRRGVIFVDLAMAQMAALGVAAGLVLGWGGEGLSGYALALASTLVGALVIAFLRRAADSVPLEAYIGIVFVSAQALAIMLLSRTPGGTEHLREALIGMLLTVSPKQLATTALIYLVIGVVHFLLRKRFLLVTVHPVESLQKGMNLFYWDLLFYSLFGLVVTLAVRMAGILLVFGLLVIPASAGILLSDRTGVRLAIGWVFSALTTLVGIVAALRLDLPLAPAILLAMTAGLGVVGLIRKR